MKCQKKPSFVRAFRFDPTAIAWPEGVFLAEGCLTGYRILTLEGPQDVSPGDWIVTGKVGEKWPVPPDRFAKLYASAPEGIAPSWYLSIPSVRDAICMPNDFTIHCSTGDLRGKAGDYLVLATPDDAYPVAAAIFAATYEVLGG